MQTIHFHTAADFDSHTSFKWFLKLSTMTCFCRLFQLLAVFGIIICIFVRSALSNFLMVTSRVIFIYSSPFIVGSNPLWPVIIFAYQYFIVSSSIKYIIFEEKNCWISLSKVLGKILWALKVQTCFSHVTLEKRRQSFKFDRYAF